MIPIGLIRDDPAMSTKSASPAIATTTPVTRPFESIGQATYSTGIGCPSLCRKTSSRARIGALERRAGTPARVARVSKRASQTKSAPKPAPRAKSKSQRGTPDINNADAHPRYHFVILDYLCEPVGGLLRAGSDVTDARFVREKELRQYGLTETASRVLRTAFEIARARPKL